MNDLKQVRELRPEELEVPKDLDAADLPLAYSLSVRISWLNAAIEHQTSRILADLAGLNMLEWRCLATLCVHGPKNGLEIASLCNVGPPQASRGLRSLGAEGLVSWERGSERRAYGPAEVTRAGWDLYRKISPVMRARNRWLLEDLAREERDELFRLLAIVRKKVAGMDIEELIATAQSEPA